MLSDSQIQDASLNADSDPLAEYASLKRHLYTTALVITAVAFVAVFVAYSLNTALFYLLGAVGGLLYFRMLDRSVQRADLGGAHLGSATRVGIFALIMLIAIKSGTQAILPTFLGFLTIKLAILLYALRTLFGEV
jgi:ATP synthase protein I